MSIDDWLIAGPFVNESGKAIDETVDKLVIDCRDEDWIKGLNEIARYSFPVHWFDSLRIYEVRH